MKMPSGFTGEVPEFHFVAAVAVEKKVGEGVQWQWIHPDQSVSRNETLVIEWHRVVLETPFAGAFVSDIYI